MKTNEALPLAPMGVQEMVLAHYGYEITGNRHFECPFCNQKKFRINYAEKLGGQYAGICVCGSYPLIKLAEHRSKHQGKEFLDEVDRLIGNDQEQIVPTNEKTPEQRAIDLFKSGVSLKGTQAQTYLKARGINDTPGRGCVYIDKMPFYDDTGKIKCFYGAIYCLMTNDLGRPVKEHITYLKDGHKAPEESYRKIRTLSKMGGSVACRTFNGQEVMAVGEGLESCLAFTQARRIPCIPTMNTANLKNFRCADFVRTLYICADNDYNGAGLAAAFACAHGNILQRPNLERVIIQYPDTLGTDFNDALINSDKIREQIVCKKPK